MENRTILFQGLVCFVAVATLLGCGSNSPIGPSSVPAHDPIAASGSTAEDAITDSVTAPDASMFQEALARLGSPGLPSRIAAVGEVSSLSPMDWAITLLRFPKTNQSFKVNQYGMFPSPAPKFRLELTAPHSIPDAGLLLYFLTSGGRECGLATTDKTLSFSTNTPKTVDIPNAYIIVGPDACVLPGQNCTLSQCKLPLTTTKLRIRFGDAQGTATGTINLKYKWHR